MRFLIAMLLLQVVVNCAPERAEAIRTDRSLTLGLPGASVRLNGSIDVGATGLYIPKTTSTMETDDTGFGLTASGNEDERTREREVSIQSKSMTGFMRYYPVQTSAFFIGLAFSRQIDRVGFDELTADSTGEDQTFTNVEYEYETTHLGLPIGWAWIWESGFSLGLDLGPKVRISDSRRYTNEGDTAVNESERDETIEAIEKFDSKISFGNATGILGYSF